MRKILSSLSVFRIRALNLLKQKLVPYFKNPAFRCLVSIYYKFARKCLRIKLPLFDSMAMVALTYRCQCRCKNCGSDLFRYSQKETLKRNEVMRLIDEFAKSGGTKIYFFGGEPLLVPELTDFTRYAKMKGLMVKLDTNAFLLDENMAKKLKEAGIDFIGVSLDSPFEATHDRLRGIGGIFAKALSGIEYCKKYGIGCYISTYATKDNLRNGELIELINLARSFNIKVRIVSSICSGKWVNREDVVLSPEEIILLRSLLEEGKVYWETEIVNSRNSLFLCSALKKDLFYITAYGDVQPCCFLSISFGNIREEPLRDIVKRMWDSDIFVNCQEYNDCPANNKDFRDKYRKAMELNGKYPEKFKYCLPENDVKEWDAWAPTYEKEIDHLLGINDDMICSKINFERKNVLDVGCGTGRFVKMIAHNALDIVALDFSDNMLKKAEKGLKDFCNISFKKVDIEEVSFSFNEKFDVIIAISVMHHIRNIGGVAEKLKSYLTRGGQIIIVDSFRTTNIRAICLFYSKIIQKYGFSKCFRTIFHNSFFNSHLKEHLAKENYTEKDFKKKYKVFFPGAKIETINGIFGFLVWSNKK